MYSIFCGSHDDGEHGSIGWVAIYVDVLDLELRGAKHSGLQQHELNILECEVEQLNPLGSIVVQQWHPDGDDGYSQLQFDDILLPHPLHDFFLLVQLQLLGLTLPLRHDVELKFLTRELIQHRVLPLNIHALHRHHQRFVGVTLREFTLEPELDDDIILGFRVLPSERHLGLLRYRDLILLVLVILIMDDGLRQEAGLVAYQPNILEVVHYDVGDLA